MNNEQCEEIGFKIKIIKNKLKLGPFPSLNN